MIDNLEQIKHVRKRIGMTQKELALQSGLSQSMIAKVESGRLDPAYTNAKKIFSILELIRDKKESVAKDFIKKGMICARLNDSIKDITIKMKLHDISQLPVIDDQKIMGLISETVILENLFKGKKCLKVKDIMEEPPPSVSMNTSSKILSELLKTYPLVVINDTGKPAGIITKSDLIQKIYSD